MTILETIGKIAEILKSVGGLIKPKGKLKEEVRSPEFQQEFLKQDGNNIILNVKGDLCLGYLSGIPAATKKELLDSFNIIEEEKQKKDINFFDVKFYPRVSEYSNTKIYDDLFDKYLKYLKPATRNLFEMSIYTKTLFNIGKSVEANNIKEDIGQQYGKMGRKFCNLYLQGYVHNYIEFLIEKFGDETKEFKMVFETEIKNFVEHSDTISFIHKNSDLNIILLRVLVAINRKETYIAIHAGGNRNIENARKVISDVKKAAFDGGYKIKEENVESKTKCPLLNVYITRALTDEDLSSDLATES